MVANFGSPAFLGLIRTGDFAPQPYDWLAFVGYSMLLV